MVFVSSNEFNLVRNLHFTCLSEDGKKQFSSYQAFLSKKVPSPQSDPVYIIIPTPPSLKMVQGYGDLFSDMANLYPTTKNMAKEPIFSSDNRTPADKILIVHSFAGLKKCIESDELVESLIPEKYKSSYEFVVLKYPPVNAAIKAIHYVHDAPCSNVGYVPITGAKEKGRDHYVYNVNGIIGVAPPITQLNNSFRWDMIKDFNFPRVEVIRYCKCDSFERKYDLLLRDINYNKDGRTLVSPDGTVFTDETSLKLMSFKEENFKVRISVMRYLVRLAGTNDPTTFIGKSVTFYETKGKLILKYVSNTDEITFFEVLLVTAEHPNTLINQEASVQMVELKQEP